MRVGVTSQVFDRIMNALPANGIESKFSMPYILARALADGALVLDTFTDEAAADPAIRRIAGSIVMELDNGLVETADGARPADVTVRLKDGGELRRRVDHSRGRPEKPMTPAETAGQVRYLREQGSGPGAEPASRGPHRRPGGPGEHSRTLRAPGRVEVTGRGSVTSGPKESLSL